MISINDIKNAKSINDLDELLEKAAAERNCELDGCSTYREAADFFEEQAPSAGNGEIAMEELAELLIAADAKWFELEA